MAGRAGAVAVVLIAAATACTRGDARQVSLAPHVVTTTSAPASTPATAPPVATVPPTLPEATDTTAIASSVPSSTPSTAPAPAPVRTVTMAFSGDILPHSPLWGRAADTARAEGRTGFDFTPMLAGLAPLLATVDVAVCHLETPIAPAGESLSTMPYYGVPAEIADAIVAAGYDRCSTASNHTYDRGSAGIDRTVNVLEAAGIEQSGMARTPAEIEPHVFHVNGVGIAHLSYTWSYNGLRLPEGEEWRSALIDPYRIVDDAREARRRGAEIVVVSLHAGSEGDHRPTQYQRDVATWLAASGEVDLIVGHHAHVVQPIERIHGVWVVFGLGNLLSNMTESDHWPAAAQDGMVVTVALHVGPDGEVRVDRPAAHATWVDRTEGWIVRVVDAELLRSDLDDRKRFQLAASRERTRAVVGDLLWGTP